LSLAITTGAQDWASARVAQIRIDLEIAGLRRRDRREKRPVWFDVEERRSIQAIETAHQQGCVFDRDQRDDR